MLRVHVSSQARLQIRWMRIKAKHRERKVESDHQEKIDEILRRMRIKVKHREREKLSQSIKKR